MTNNSDSRSACRKFKFACVIPLAVLIVAFAGGTQKALAWKVLEPQGFEPVGAVSSSGEQVVVEFITSPQKAKKNDFVDATIIIFQPHTGAMATTEWHAKAGEPVNMFPRAELIPGSPTFEEGPVWAWYLAQHFDAKGNLVNSESNLVPVYLFEDDE